MSWYDAKSGRVSRQRNVTHDNPILETKSYFIYRPRIFRLPPEFFRQHLLWMIRNDFSVCVVAIYFCEHFKIHLTWHRDEKKHYRYLRWDSPMTAICGFSLWTLYSTPCSTNRRSNWRFHSVHQSTEAVIRMLPFTIPVTAPLDFKSTLMVLRNNSKHFDYNRWALFFTLSKLVPTAVRPHAW